MSVNELGLFERKEAPEMKITIRSKCGQWSKVVAWFLDLDASFRVTVIEPDTHLTMQPLPLPLFPLGVHTGRCTDTPPWESAKKDMVQRKELVPRNTSGNKKEKRTFSVNWMVWEFCSRVCRCWSGAALLGNLQTHHARTCRKQSI